MKLRLKIILLLLSCFLFQSFFSQEKIGIGEKTKVFSKILNEEREIWVHLPKSYRDNTIKPAKYPVIYLLDAEINFEYFAPMTDYLSRAPFAEMPESIVIGIANTDRTRDLTPTKASKKSPINGKMLFENSGGIETFLQFVQEELKPFVQKKYRTEDYSMFVGHSFGGLAVIYCMTMHSGFFNAYVSHDPSLWWDREVMLRKTEDFLKNNSNKFPENIRLFISQANSEEQNKIWNSDKADGILHYREKLDKNKSLKYEWKFYENEDHGHVSLPANFDALKYLFKGYKTDLKLLAKKPQLLEENYRKFSKNAEYKFEPSESYLNIIIKFMKENDFLESKNYFEKLKAEKYPD